MRLISPIVTLDVDIEGARTEDRTLVLSGFAGLNEIEARVSGAEMWRLIGLLARGSVIWLLMRSVFSRRAD